MSRKETSMHKALRLALDEIAKNNGYADKFDLLRDYSFIPTVLTPKHRKIEIAKLFYNHLKKKR